MKEQQIWDFLKHHPSERSPEELVTATQCTMRVQEIAKKYNFIPELKILGANFIRSDYLKYTPVAIARYNGPMAVPCYYIANTYHSGMNDDTKRIEYPYCLKTFSRFTVAPILFSGTDLNTNKPALFWFATEMDVRHSTAEELKKYARVDKLTPLFNNITRPGAAYDELDNILLAHFSVEDFESTSWLIPELLKSEEKKINEILSNITSKIQAYNHVIQHTGAIEQQELGEI